MQKIQLQGTIPETMSGLRVDQAISRIFPDFSRARLQLWIKSGEILLDNRMRKPKERVAGGEEVCIDATLNDLNPVSEAEDIELDIVYEDDALLVLNKPAGLVVHPGAGNAEGTLLNALLHHCPGLTAVPRAGIIHRLDKNTTGLMVVAKTLAAHHYLVDAMQERAIKREYETIVHGVMIAGGTIDAPVGRHSVDRKRMAVTENGKPAITHYRVLKRFRLHTHVRVQLETGRTHQIRVHMAHKRYPVVGDPAYGGRMRLPPGATPELLAILQSFPRQALHAIQLAVPHPDTGEMIQWTTTLPEDMQTLISVLEADMENSAK